VLHKVKFLAETHSGRSWREYESHRNNEITTRTNKRAANKEKVVRRTRLEKKAAEIAQCLFCAVISRRIGFMVSVVNGGATKTLLDLKDLLINVYVVFVNVMHICVNFE
jgi:hypothetical protein